MFILSRGVSNATTYDHCIRVCFPSPPRHRLAGEVSQPMLGWAGQEIPPRRSLYARSPAEMAREELSRSRIGRGHVSSAAIDPSNPAQLRASLYDEAVESM